jgi:ABC-type lipoprotein export system ATPase subunit
MLVLIDVVKEYPAPGGAGANMKVLKGVSLKIEKGQSLAIVGPSGSGKSTLLNMIGGLDRPTSGKVLLDESNLATLDDDALARVRNLKIGFVFQLHHLLPQLTVLENVLIPTLAGKKKSNRQENAARAESLLERVGLSDWMSHRPGELSGGQMQRVAVVRALINKPSLLLADEPTGSLDKAASGNIADLLVELNESESVTLITVTHSMDLAQRMGKVLEISDGEIV